eukprot:9197927-Alexandrium_andersonii.AAC.1
MAATCLANDSSVSEPRLENPGTAEHSAMLAQKYINAGKAIIDSGASESIGGIRALEALTEAMRQNRRDTDGIR